MQQQTNQKISYIPGIDGLRAIAVLAVFLFHFDPSILPGGFSGVDVFFVISGYVVSASLVRETQTSFLKFAANFYARRIIRIYPALVVCLTFFGILQTLFVPDSWLSSTTDNTALFAFFGLSNFALIWFNDRYFSPRVDFNPFAHTWTLGVEEQFYLLFPIVIFIWLKWKDRNDTAGVFAKCLLPILLLLSLIYSWYETAAMRTVAYYLLPSRFWELASGALLFKLHKQNRLVAHSVFTSAASVIAGLILISLGFTFSDPSSFPFPWALLSVSGALFVIIGVASDFWGKLTISGILDNKVIVYFGKISYSLYLWHWPILVMFKWTTGLDKPLVKPSVIMLTLILSIFSYHVIEKPIRQNVFIKSKPTLSILSSGLTIIVLCCFFTGMVFMVQPNITLSVTRDRYNWYPEEWSTDNHKVSSKKGKVNSRQLFVLGDSHAGAYRTILRMLREEQGVDVYLYTQGGCSIVNLISPPTPECSEFIENTLIDIETMAKPGDIVFLASLRMNRLGDQHRGNTINESQILANQLGSDSSANRKLALQEADNLLNRLDKASLNVVMDAPKPVFKSPPFRCSDWFNADNPVCANGFTVNRNFLLQYRKPVMESIDVLLRNHKKLIVWDTFPTLCPSDICSAFDNKIPLFFDGDHLSAHGNRVLYPSFLSMLASNRLLIPIPK